MEEMLNSRVLMQSFCSCSDCRFSSHYLIDYFIIVRMKIGFLTTIKSFFLYLIQSDNSLMKLASQP